MISPVAVEKMPGENGDMCEFFSVCCEPFTVHGLLPKVEGESFRRLPKELVPKLYKNLCGAVHTSGGRVRFATDSPFICVRSFSAGYTVLPGLTLASSIGYDLYMDKGRERIFKGTFKPPVDAGGKYLKYVDGKSYDFELDSSEECFTASLDVGNGGVREYTINMPVFSGVKELYIGVKQGSVLLGHTPYTVEKPVVYYGSSITHGAMVSRPGLMYQHRISRKLDCDFINLGFSGSAKGEPEMAEFIASLDMSVFVMDYDHNAPNVEHLVATHSKFFSIIRQKHPDLPVVFVTKPDGDFASVDNMKRKAVIFDTFRTALENGDKNVFFIDGASFFPDDVRQDCTFDRCHPNDLGFHYMAQSIGEAVKCGLKKRGYSF